MTLRWNLADIWEAVAALVPDRESIICGDERVTWKAFDAHADALAGVFVDGGLLHQDKVAQYMHNSPAYLEGVFGAFKAGLVPVNTNYRYGEDELTHLWNNADVAAVVFHGSFTERVAKVRSRVPAHLFIWVDDGTEPCPEWASSYETAIGGPVAGPRDLASKRSDNDLYLLYTGGTTGMPKGVMWPQGTLSRYLNEGAASPCEEGLPLEVHLRARAPFTAAPTLLSACPLMHGTGAFTAFRALLEGGRVVLLAGRSFSAVELLDATEREGVTNIALVGDAFARPIVSALEDQPNRWDLSCLETIVSSGVMFSEEVKQGLLRHLPTTSLVDALASSEALGLARSVTTVDAPVGTARFDLLPHTTLVDDEGRRLELHPGTVGRLAVRHHVPLGYYKDTSANMRTFFDIDGERHSIPGDYARVEADGTITLLGRGSQCINTGGEKVYPEEVEEVLKQHEHVVDAAVVSVPGSRFGERVVAVLVVSSPRPDALESDVTAHARSRLASYKVPKHVLVVESLGRSASGKLDYRAITRIARERVGESLAGLPSPVAK